MLNRLREILLRQGFDEPLALRLIEVVATYAREGPSLTLGGVGVLPLDDDEDRHVLETAFAGRADLLVTQNLADFVGEDAQPLCADRTYGARHGGSKLLIIHTYNAAAWMQGGAPSLEAQAYLAG